MVNHWWAVGDISAGGCGSVMRAWPFGILFAYDQEKAITWAAQHSLLTHGAPIAQASCAALAAGIAFILKSEALDQKISPDMVVEQMINAAGRYDKTTAQMIRQAALDAKNNIQPSIILQAHKGSAKLLEGWAAHQAIAAATYIFVLSPDSLSRAIELGVNSTGDSDSIATIAGALVGAYASISDLCNDQKKLVGKYHIENREDLLNLVSQT